MSLRLTALYPFACAQFIRNRGALIYRSAILDPAREDDGDDLPNCWEQAHGLDPLNAADANANPGGDSVRNLQKYFAITDPTKSASDFLTSAIAQEGNNVRVT
jgi:hypothetical protein